MYCKYCGKKIDEDSIYCSYCGRRINGGNALIEELEEIEGNEQLPEDLDEDIAHIIQRVEKEFKGQQGAEKKSLGQTNTEGEKICIPIENKEEKPKEMEEASSHSSQKENSNEILTERKDKKGVSYNTDKTLLLKGFEGEYTEYKVSKGVVCICDSAFYKNNSIQSVSFPRSLITIGSFAFGDCEKLKEVFLHKGIKTIKEGAFWGCLSLNDILFYEGLESIGDDAFYNCKSLKKITLPKSLKEIGERVFEGCTSLKTIFVPKDRVEFFREKLKMGSEIVKPKPTFWDW